MMIRALKLIAPLLCLLLLACTADSNTEGPPAHKILRIEVREYEGEYRLFLNDEPEPSTTDQIMEVLETYAEIEDEAAGMPGRDKFIGVARNPLFYRAPHGAPWKLFARVMEMAVAWKYPSIVVQLQQRAGGIAECPLGLPMDEGLSFIREGSLDLRINARGGRVSYDARVCMYDEEKPFTRIVSEDYTPLRAGEHATAWDTVPETTAPEIAKRLREILGESAERVNDMAVLFHGDLNWGEMFLVICASHELEKLLGRESEGYFNVHFWNLDNPPSWAQDDE